MTQQQIAAQALHLLHRALGFTAKTMSVPFVMTTGMQEETWEKPLSPAVGIRRALSNFLHLVIITRTVFFIFSLGFSREIKWKAPDGLFTRDFVYYMHVSALATTVASVCAKIQYDTKAVIEIYNAVVNFRSRFSRMERMQIYFLLIFLRYS